MPHVTSVTMMRIDVVVLTLDSPGVGRRDRDAEPVVDRGELGFDRALGAVVSDEVAVHEDVRHDATDATRDDVDEHPDDRIAELRGLVTKLGERWRDAFERGRELVREAAGRLPAPTRTSLPHRAARRDGGRDRGRAASVGTRRRSRRCRTSTTSIRARSRTRTRSRSRAGAARRRGRDRPMARAATGGGPGCGGGS